MRGYLKPANADVFLAVGSRKYVCVRRLGYLRLISLTYDQMKKYKNSCVVCVRSGWNKTHTLSLKRKLELRRRAKWLHAIKMQNVPKLFSSRYSTGQDSRANTQNAGKFTTYFYFFKTLMHHESLMN